MTHWQRLHCYEESQAVMYQQVNTSNSNNFFTNSSACWGFVYMSCTWVWKCTATQLFSELIIYDQEFLYSKPPNQDQAHLPLHKIFSSWTMHLADKTNLVTSIYDRNAQKQVHLCLSDGNSGLFFSQQLPSLLLVVLFFYVFVFFVKCHSN